ncbi:MAG: ABC transporter permease subunit [Byssovorax sp.]
MSALKRWLDKLAGEGDSGRRTSEPVSALESFVSHLVLLLAVCFALYPVLWVVSLAFSGSRTQDASVLPIPHDPTLAHLKAVVLSTRTTPEGESVWLFGRQLANSVVVSLATAAVGVIIAIPTAYALARFRFLGKERGVAALLATQMFPTVASAIPLYLLLDMLHLLNSRTGLVLCYASTSVPFAIFQLRAAFEAIPVDLEEAAMVDGATRFEAFLRVVLPAARPAIAVTALFAFMSAYNEFILAATLLSREEMFTLPVMLQRYIGEYSAQWEKFAAGALVVSIPVMALFYLAQRHLVAGLTSGGVKG